MSSVLLINEPPLQVLPSLAKCIGLNEALILQQVHYWIQPARNRNIFDNRYWVYNTYEQWREQFPFWSKSTISRTILNLESMGVILSRESGGRIKFYTIDYDKLQKINETQNASISIQNDVTIDSNCIDVSIQNESMIDSNCIDVYIDTETTQRILSDIESIPEGDAQDPPPEGGGVCRTHSVSAPINKKESKSHSKRKEERGSSLDEDWTLPQEYRDWSLQNGMSDSLIDKTADDFKHHWLTTVKNPIKKRWHLVWRKWCNDRHKYSFNNYFPGNYSQSRPVTPTLPTEISNIHVQSTPRHSDNPKIQQWYDMQPQLKERVGTADYNSWLAELELVSFDEKVVFKAKNAFMADWVYNRFINDIAAILAKIDPNLGIEIDIKAVL